MRKAAKTREQLESELASLARRLDEATEALAEARDQQRSPQPDEELYRVAFENANDAIAIDSADERLFVNETFLRIYGLKNKSEAITKPVGHFVVPEDWDEVHQRGLARLRGESVPDVYECRIQRPNGDVRTIQCSVVAISYKGRPAGLALHRDITELKQVEEELARRAEELGRSNLELEQFAYVASHDLQEPLRMISSYVQLLACRYGDRLDSDADEFISFAVDGASRMQRLIDDLLEYSRVGSKGRPFRQTECEAVLSEAVGNLQTSIDASGASVIHDRLPVLVADASQLVLLFQNLIGNSIKFRSEEPPRVHVSARRDGLAWVLSVRDNGIGIAPRHQERIFNIFERLQPRTEYPGTGIGLAICKKIVDRHNGTISVESDSGTGATISVTLPILDETKGDAS